jgi:hypothetical protein
MTWIIKNESEDTIILAAVMAATVMAYSNDIEPELMI